MISERAKKLKGSPTLALASKAKELQAQGQDVISLSVGEPDWDTFASVKRAAIRAIEAGLTKYTPTSGTPELRKAIAEITTQELGVEYKFQQVTVSSGGKFVLFSALQCLLNPGDEVVIPSPYWVSYPEMVELTDGIPVIVDCPAEAGFKLTAEALTGVISKKTKMLILNSPSNPTGEVYTLQELKALAQVLEGHPQVVILSDDIYNRLVFQDSGLAPHILQAEPKLQDRTLVVNGVSKTYSMTGWRLGWALGPLDVIAAMDKYQSQSTSCASSITQAAALAAITGDGQELKSALKTLKVRRDFIYKELLRLPGIQVTEPQGAFYIWPNISTYFGKSYRGQRITGSMEFSQKLLESQGVATVPGFDFGLEGYLRLSYVIAQSRMEEALRRLGAFLSELHSD
jgi:aspartate aminotransferase